MKTKRWIIGLILIVIAVAAYVAWRWYSSHVYTEKKGEEAVKIISENPDAIFDPKAEKKAIDQQEKEEREKKK